MKTLDQSPVRTTELYHVLSSPILIHLCALGGVGRRSKKSSPAVWAILLHARELGASCALGQPQNHWPLTGGAFQGMRVVLWLDICVFFMQHDLQT